MQSIYQSITDLQIVIDTSQDATLRELALQLQRRLQSTLIVPCNFRRNLTRCGNRAIKLVCYKVNSQYLTGTMHFGICEDHQDLSLFDDAELYNLHVVRFIPGDKNLSSCDPINYCESSDGSNQKENG